MEQKIDMKQDRENEKFWQYWMKSESTLVVGNELNDIPKVKEKVANKLGLHKRSITPTTLEKVVFDVEIRVSRVTRGEICVLDQKYAFRV